MEFIKKDTLIILIGGKARSGKSSVGKILEEEFSSKKVITSPYTKYLKKYIEEITNSNIDDENKPRYLLQHLSSDLIKPNKPDFFINRQIEDLEIYSYFFDIVIVPDVRFPREIDIIKEKFEKVISIGVVRENYTSELSLEEQKDITETALDNYELFDYVIKNKTEASLKEDTLKIVDSLRKEGITNE